MTIASNYRRYEVTGVVTGDNEKLDINSYILTVSMLEEKLNVVNL